MYECLLEYLQYKTIFSEIPDSQILREFYDQKKNQPRLDFGHRFTFNIHYINYVKNNWCIVDAGKANIHYTSCRVQR